MVVEKENVSTTTRRGRPHPVRGTVWLTILCGFQCTVMMGFMILSSRWFGVLPPLPLTRASLITKKSFFMDHQNPTTHSSLRHAKNGFQSSPLVVGDKPSFRDNTDNASILVSKGVVARRSIDESMRYPIGNRSIILPEQPACPALVQAIPWRRNLPDPRPSTRLKVNPDCPYPPASRLAKMNDLFLLRRGGNTTKSSNKPRKHITVALLYYQDMALLSRVLDNWLKWETSVREQFDFLIIDDGSQIGLRAMDLLWPHRQRWQSKLDLAVYEVEQDLAWNIGGCRNLAHLAAKTPFVLTTDTDVEINSTVAAYSLQLLAPQNGTALSQRTERGGGRIIWKFFNQQMPDGKTFEPHPAVMLASKDAYWAVGGCDEDLVGNYGQTDILFLWKADRDKTIKVHSVSKEMQQRNLFVRKIWKPESNQCISWARKTCQLAPLAWRKKRPRILKYNMKVFGQKKRNEAPFSNKYLKFRFHRAFPRSDHEALSK